MLGLTPAHEQSRALFFQGIEHFQAGRLADALRAALAAELASLEQHVAGLFALPLPAPEAADIIIGSWRFSSVG